MKTQEYIRPQAVELEKRLREPRHVIQSIAGARQVGKTTLVRQVVERVGLPYHFANADEPTLRTGDEWIAAQWEVGRQLADEPIKKGGRQEKCALLILDEIQKIPNWSAVVKLLWDEDTRNNMPLKVVLLGSAPLLLGRGLSESLAGRFETLYLPHWSYPEMNRVFGWSLQQYLFYGAYPGAAPFIKDHDRWSRYIKDSLIETTLSRDVLLLSRVDKPALLRQLFELSCAYSGQILSYRKLAGHLEEKGYVTTLAHYLDLLSAAGTLTGLQKYFGSEVMRRRSIPKLQVFNTALMTAQCGMTEQEALNNPEFVGRLMESAVGAHLLNAATAGEYKLFYWRENDYEVDFVLCRGKKLVAIEVKSGRPRTMLLGMEVFSKKFRPTKKLLVGKSGIPLEKFLSTPAAYWVS